MLLIARNFNVRQYEDLLFNVHPDKDIRKEKQDQAKQWRRDYLAYISTEKYLRSRLHPRPKVTNQEFMKDPLFIEACNEAGVTPTVRQASKFRNKKGKAFRIKNNEL